MENSLVSWGGRGDFKSHCGYCSRSGFVSTGMLASRLTAHDYQSLVDRGWRRCGSYLYKLNNKKTCCPHYTIRCDAVNLQLTKSQKKTLRKFNAFLLNKISITPGSTPKEPSSDLNKSDLQSQGNDDSALPTTNSRPLSKKERKYIQSLSLARSVENKGGDDSVCAKSCPNNNQNVSSKGKEPQDTQNSLKVPVAGANKHEGEKESRPKCKKAKIARLERRKAKMEKKGISVADITKKRVNEEKTLEDYINEVTQENSIRKLEITLDRSISNAATHEECFQLYKKYQQTIHQDSDNTFEGYGDFLMLSPLNEVKREADSEHLPHGYGTYHQLYRVDGKLIAVGVLDVLPRCVSSVYFFYDPDYMHLNIGTYGALRELELTRKLAKHLPTINQYYLGYYIHSCQKMRYKGQWKPSYLLCPEAYSWHPLAECQSKLEVASYARLNPDVDAKSEEDDVDVGAIRLFRDRIRPPICVRDCSGIDEHLHRVFTYYACHVGKSAAENMLLRFCPSSSDGSPSDDSD